MVTYFNTLFHHSSRKRKFQNWKSPGRNKCNLGWKVWGSRSGFAEDKTAWGSYVVSIGKQVPVPKFWRLVVTSHISLDCLSLTMKALWSFALLITTYRLTRFNIPEGLNLKSKVSGNKAFTEIFGRDKLRDSYRSTTTVTVIAMGRSWTAGGKVKKCMYRKAVWNVIWKLLRIR